MSIITIGNFDGCHRGHRELIAETLLVARRLRDDKPIALTFNPRPEAFFKTLDHELLLTTITQKQRAFSELGLQGFQCLDFNQDMAAMTAEVFLEKVLLQQFNCRHLVIGEDFHFGKNRVGNAAWLTKHTDPQSLGLSVVKTYQFNGGKIGSSSIRQLICEQGDLTTALDMLGRPYLLEGVVKQGQQLGRTIGFPTINLGNINQIIPKPGVYAGYLWLESPENKTPTIMTCDQTACPAVFNIGYKPTVTPLTSLEHSHSVEGHVLGKHSVLQALSKQDSYGLSAGFYFCNRLRDEQKFASLEDLKTQIAKDCIKGLEVLEALKSLQTPSYQ